MRRSERLRASHRRLPGGLHGWPGEAAEVPKALPAVHRAALPGYRHVRMIPIYLLYIRSQEDMMLETFGDAYREYRRVVPMLFPRPRPATA